MATYNKKGKTSPVHKPMAEKRVHSMMNDFATSNKTNRFHNRLTIHKGNNILPRTSPDTSSSCTMTTDHKRPRTHLLDTRQDGCTKVDLTKMAIAPNPRGWLQCIPLLKLRLRDPHGLSIALKTPCLGKFHSQVGVGGRRKYAGVVINPQRIISFGGSRKEGCSRPWIGD